MNTLFVLLDGMEDDPHPALGGKKPYEAAKMPFMYRKAGHKFHTTGRGYTQLFLNEFFTGHPPELPRAVLEAIALGMDISGKRTAYRLSPAELKDGMIRWSYHDAHLFCDELMKTMEKNLHILDGYAPELRFFLNGRAVLTMECDDVPDLPAPPVDAPFKEVPGDLGRFVMKVAEDMHGITDYPWGCGKYTRQYPPFPCIKKMTAISDSPTALGVAASLGHKIHHIDAVEDRFPLAKKALEKSNVFLHIDEVDEYSHQKDPYKKIDILERTDRLMEEYFHDAERVVYFVDHGTSCVTGEHIIMNVPLWTNIETDMPDGELIPLGKVIPSLMR